MDNYISSTKNQKIKNLKKLNETKYRLKTDMFLVEGKKCIEEATLVENLCIELLILEEEEAKYFDLIQKVPNVTYVSSEVLKYISNSISPQSIICVCNKKNLEIQSNSGLIIALDNISDPGNLGAIIRSADAVDACEILLLNDCVDFLSPKVIRASMGSVFHLRIQKADKSKLHLLKENGYKIVGADIKGSETFDYESENICLIIGSEAHGISEDIADDLDVSSFVEWPEKISAKACEAFSGKKFLIKIERTEKKGEREIEFCEQ